MCVWWEVGVDKEKAEKKLLSQTDPDNNRKMKSGGANKTVHTEKREREM